MIQKSNISFLPLLILLAACTARPVVPVVSRPATVERLPGYLMRVEYVHYVEQGRRYLRMGRFDLAEGYFEVASHEQFFEAPNYDVWIELAEAQCRNGKTEEAHELLANYDMALKVDYGKESCVDIWDPALTSPPNPRMSMKVFATLCSADVSPIVAGNLLKDERQKYEPQYLDLAEESAVLARSCEGISSVR